MRWRLDRPIIRWVVLGLWVATVLGPFGPAAGLLHHHADGDSDYDPQCAACALVYAPYEAQAIFTPPPIVRTAAPLEVAPHPRLAVPEPLCDNLSRAPPPATGV